MPPPPPLHTQVTITTTADYDHSEIIEFSSGCGFGGDFVFRESSNSLEGCVLVGHCIARFLIFSDRLLNILLAMYLVSNKVASNPAKITVFLHLSNRSEGVQSYPECQGFNTLFSVFMLYRISAKSILPPKIAYFFLLLYLGKY